MDFIPIQFKASPSYNFWQRTHESIFAVVKKTSK